LPFKDARAHLRDIAEGIEQIEEFVAGLDFEGFRDDSKTRAAVERKLMVISEAAVRLKDDGEALCPNVPWRDVRGIGNWLRHQYDRVDIETLWNTIQDDLPVLKIAVNNALNSLKP